MGARIKDAFAKPVFAQELVQGRQEGGIQISRQPLELSGGTALEECIEVAGIQERMGPDSLNNVGQFGDLVSE